jgi:transcriptional regulator with XRE-family HTH domain
MLPAMLAHDRTRAGWSVEQVARRLVVSVRTYRKLEAGERSPAWETWGSPASLSLDVRERLRP